MLNVSESTKNLRTDEALPFRADVPQAISMRVRLLNLIAVVLRLAVVANRPGLLAHFRTRLVGSRFNKIALWEVPCRSAKTRSTESCRWSRVRR